ASAPTPFVSTTPRKTSATTRQSLRTLIQASEKRSLHSPPAGDPSNVLLSAAWAWEAAAIPRAEACVQVTVPQARSSSLLAAAATCVGRCLQDPSDTKASKAKPFTKPSTFA